ATPASTTDPEARNYRQSGTVGAKLAYLGHTRMENRTGLMVDAEVSQADGYGERETAQKLLTRRPGKRRQTVGADKGYDTRDFVTACRAQRISAHIARNTERPGGSALDGRTTRHRGYETSWKVRKRIEEGLGWAKTIGQIRQVKVRGKARVNDVFLLTFVGWNLTRMRNLQARCV
ncbi:transposase IS4 family protein, partial [mine drainage metagenome]